VVNLAPQGDQHWAEDWWIVNYKECRIFSGAVGARDYCWRKETVDDKMQDVVLS
jgi:hypothetical protein